MTFAALVGLLAALVLGATSASASSASSGHHVKPPQTKVIANALLVMLNRERAAHHLPALTMNADLVESAHGHNLAMAKHDLMSHQCPGEAPLATRISRTGYKWSWAGENIGWNSVMNLKGVLRLESIMYNEKPPNDGHRLNILNKHFRNIGVDVVMDKVHKKVWLTTDFGRH